MSNAEIKAHQLYDAMKLDDVSEDVKRHLMILILSKYSTESPVEQDGHQIPMSYREALQMGAMDLELAREELHKYVDDLSKEFGIR